MHTVIDNKNYTIVLTTNFSAQLAQFINSNTYSKVVYLFDTNTFRLYGNLPCFDATQSIVIPSGESYKTIETCNEVWQQLLHLNADRNTLLVNVGGGMVSDLGGFVASTYKRGIHFINLPTTLLACVDASIGGKTAVNCGDTKNIIGAFCNPQHVIIDTVFLNTLPANELLSGFGEILKHGLIANATYFEACSALNLSENTINWLPIIETSLRIKQQIVAQDFDEQNIRKKLNAGHTIGHALETVLMQSSKRLTHGEYVAIGLLVESSIALQQCLISPTDFDIISTAIQRHFKPQKMNPKPHDWQALNNALLNDKKNDSATINASLLTGIGSCAINCAITLTEIEHAISQHIVVSNA